MKANADVIRDMQACLRSEEALQVRNNRAIEVVNVQLDAEYKLIGTTIQEQGEVKGYLFQYDRTQEEIIPNGVILFDGSEHVNLEQWPVEVPSVKPPKTKRRSVRNG